MVCALPIAEEQDPLIAFDERQSPVAAVLWLLSPKGRFIGATA